MREGVVPTRSDIFRSSRTDKQGRPMNAAAERIFRQLDEVQSQGDPDGSGPHDFLSQVLGPEHSGRIRCRPGHTPTSYWSASSSSSHVSGSTVSQEQLDTALAQVAQARQESAQLRSVITALLTRLSSTHGDDYLGLQEMLNVTQAAPVPPAPAAAPPGPAAAPPCPAPAPPGPAAAAPPGPAPAPRDPATAPFDPVAAPLGDDDDIFGDFDLQDF